MSDLKISVESLRLNNSGKGTAKAFARVDVNGVVSLDGYRVVNGSKGLFVSAPQQQSKKNKRYYDFPFRVKSEGIRKAISTAILSAYEATQKASGDSGLPSA